MIDFTLTDENELVRDAARSFAEREIVPHIRDWDRAEAFPRELFGRMAELGFLGAPIPERYGGSGMDYISFALLCEELERADTAFRVVQSVHVGLNSLALLQWGTEEQRQRWLVPQAKGEKLATFGLTEPGVGTDAGNLATTARRDGESYVLNGSKLWISLADIADHFLVFASVDRSKRHKGVTAFLLERGMPGLSTGTLHGKLGIRAGNTGLITLDDVRVPVEHRIGEEGEGFLDRDERDRPGAVHGRRGRGRARPGVSRCVAPVRARAADVRRGDRPAPAREADAREHGQGDRDRAVARVAGGAGSRTTAGATRARRQLAKWLATEHSVQSALDAIQVHGANGYSDEFPVERYLRNSKAAVIYEGTRQLHTLIQADYALGYREDRPLRCEPWPAQGFERA